MLYSSLVGVTSCLTSGEGDYDNFGYGVISPVKYLMDIVTATENRRELTIEEGFLGIGSGKSYCLVADSASCVK